MDGMHDLGGKQGLSRVAYPLPPGGSYPIWMSGGLAIERIAPWPLHQSPYVERDLPYS
jgi:hypothetical protein